MGDVLAEQKCCESLQSDLFVVSNEIHSFFLNTSTTCTLLRSTHAHKRRRSVLHDTLSFGQLPSEWILGRILVTPLQHGFKISALVLSVEVRPRCADLLVPIVCQHSDIRVAHQLLAEQVCTMVLNGPVSISSFHAPRRLENLHTEMYPQHIIRLRESLACTGVVVFVGVLPKQILTRQTSACSLLVSHVS